MHPLYGFKTTVIGTKGNVVEKENRFQFDSPVELLPVTVVKMRDVNVLVWGSIPGIFSVRFHTCYHNVL